MTRHVAPVDPVGRREQYNEACRKINENDYMLLVVSLLIAMAACGAEKTENMLKLRIHFIKALVHIEPGLFAESLYLCHFLS